MMQGVYPMMQDVYPMMQGIHLVTQQRPPLLSKCYNNDNFPSQMSHGGGVMRHAFLLVICLLPYW